MRDVPLEGLGGKKHILRYFSYVSKLFSLIVRQTQHYRVGKTVVWSGEAGPEAGGARQAHGEDRGRESEARSEADEALGQAEGRHEGTLGRS